MDQPALDAEQASPAAPAPPSLVALTPPTAQGRAATRRWIVRLGVLAALVAGGVGLDQTVFAPEPVEVQVLPVGQGRVESTITNSRAGTVRARRRASLSPDASGRVIELPHREGERVEAGQVLVRLDDSSQRARVLVAQRALQVVEARHLEAHTRRDRAEQELERGQKLRKSGVVTDDDLERLASASQVTLATCDTAVAGVEQAKAEVALAQAELEKCTLRAPFPGVLADVSVEVGEWITPSPPITPIPGVIDLIDTSSIYVSAPMDEVDSAVILAGQAVRVSLDPYPEQSFAARVTRVAAFVLDAEAQNRTVEIEVELEDPLLAARLLPGTSADVEVVLEVREAVARVPSAALLQGSSVLVLEDGVLTERQVEVGIKNWDWAEVLSGLKEGERIVTNLGKLEVKAGAEAVVVTK